MNNPIKKQFQKLYNETGKKPFTFLQPFCLLILPFILLIIGMAIEGSVGSKTAIAIIIGGTAIGWIAFIVIPFKRFGKGGISVLLLSIIASILFFISFVLWPFLKFCVRGGRAITQANMGNTAASVNASQRMGATKGKKSALNWFEYEGRVWEDEKEVMPEMPAYAYDEGSYTDAQNSAARTHGYSNGKEAEASGRKWNGNDWV